MTDKSDRFHVILRDGLPAREFAFFSHLCGRLTSEKGEDLLYLKCESIDTSHHVYLQVEALWPGSERAQPMQIPHFMVMLITGRDLPRSFGFGPPQAGR